MRPTGTPAARSASTAADQRLPIGHGAARAARDQRQRIGLRRTSASAANSSAMAACPSKLITGGSPHKRGHGVEQPAHAAGARRVDAAGQQRRSSVVSSAGREPIGGRVPRPPGAEDLEQQPQGRAPRLADGPIAAGQGEGPQMRHAAEARRPRTPGPRRPRSCRRCRSRCRPRPAPAPGPPGRARPCRRPRGRDGAAPAPAARPTRAASSSACRVEA